jgi:hypothetical protein
VTVDVSGACAKKKPHLMADAPPQVWSWDITKLPSPLRGVYFDCYLIIESLNRYVVGWTVESSEDSGIAKGLVADNVARVCVPPGQLTLNTDRSTSIDEPRRESLSSWRTPG